ncbi:hypothetical protein ACHAWF_003073 [Thalassiosira exigua]
MQSYPSYQISCRPRRSVSEVMSYEPSRAETATHTTSAPVNYSRGGALNIPGLSLVHAGGASLFESSDVTLRHGTIAGLVGINGCGKTSLARLLASKDLPGFPKHLVIEYLAASDDEECLAGHIIESSSSLRPIDYIEARIQNRLDQILERIDELEGTLECSGDPVYLEEISDQLAWMYDLEEELREKAKREMCQALDELGFRSHEHKPLSALSSGWRYKCRLVAAFLTHPDLLVIDEPSFLDETSTRWFVSRTKEASKTDNAIVMLISHKETLLDTLCDSILYINAANRIITAYHCGYRAFRSVHEENVGAAKKKINDTEAKQQNADRSLKKLKAELRGRERKLKEATTQNSDKRFIKGKNKEAKQKADRSAASKAKLAKKKLEDLEDTRLQARTEHVKPLHINCIPVDGNVVSLQNVSASYDEDDGLVFEDVDVCMHAADRVLLRGANGAGKSTLVEVLLGELAPICGHVVQQGDVVYFPQTDLSDLLQLHGDESPRDFLGESLTETQARRHLGSFELARDLALRHISTLSAGQRVRLCLSTCYTPNRPCWSSMKHRKMLTGRQEIRWLR